MTNFEEDILSYKIISILGECFQGKATVNLGKHTPSGEMIAIKRFHMDKIRQEDDCLVEWEIILTRQLQHPNILQYYTAFVHGPEVYVVSPLKAFGSCKTLLHSHFNEGLPELAIIVILRDLLEAIDYLHRRGFIHRAIRASHILISAAGKACLTGLRYACPIVSNGKWQKNIHSFPSSTQPNLNWLSPELLEQNMQGYNEKSDIYSVGMACCELANGKEPFADVATTLMLIDKVRGCAPELLDCNTIPSMSEEDPDCREVLRYSGDCDISRNIERRRFSADLHEFNYICLERDPYARPTAAQLLTHPLFKLIRKGVSLPDLLKPALPLSDRVAYNKDEVANFDCLHSLSELELDTCEWDF